MAEQVQMPLADRFLGYMLGLAVGDALGAPFEGLPAEVIYREFGFMNKAES